MPTQNIIIHRPPNPLPPPLRPSRPRARVSILQLYQRTSFLVLFFRRFSLALALALVRGWLFFDLKRGGYDFGWGFPEGDTLDGGKHSLWAAG